MLSTLKVLIILTSQATMGPTPEPTGVWLEELATPYYAFVDAGFDVVLASPQGGRTPIDPRSLKARGANPASVERFLHDADAQRKAATSHKLSVLSSADYVAVFLPGGHGTMWDLPSDPALADFLSRAWSAGRVVAAVCHGPAGLVGARDESGRPLVAGRRVSAFSDAEERAAGLADKVPFLLESRLRELGALYERGPDFRPFAVRDGRLVTGQNPASSEEVARLTLVAIRDQTRESKPSRD